jgi:hypothetical protein
MKLTIAAVMAVALASSAMAKDIRVELLQASINQQTIGSLNGLACRNYDKIVHLNVSIEWPIATTVAEKTGYQRLVFSTDDAEFLFPKGSYQYEHGSWNIRGYFIVRSGGMHQGVVSNAFERVDDSQVMLNPSVVETKVESPECNPVSIEQPAPDALIRDIYSKYYGKGQEGGLPPDATKRYYAPDLLALTSHNVDESGGPIYDGDPFVQSQEVEVSSVRVETKSMNGNRAVVSAFVVNDGQPVKVDFQLVKIGGEWKIYDISDLRRIYAAHRR